MSFNIEKYIDSLPEDTYTINLSNKKLTYIPDLSRFKGLRILNVNFNQLTSLPKLNESLEILHCGYNRLTSLPELNARIIVHQ
jgi:Leucine-rich repeat (LRR) protein